VAASRQEDEGRDNPFRRFGSELLDPATTLEYHAMASRPLPPAPKTYTIPARCDPKQSRKQTARQDQVEDEGTDNPFRPSGPATTAPKAYSIPVRCDPLI
jgi:hypothetical protein